MSLSRKLLLAFVILAIGPLAAVILVFRLTFAPKAEWMVGGRLQDNAVQTARAVGNFMLTCLRDFKALAEAVELLRDSHSPATISSRLARHTYAYRRVRRARPAHVSRPERDERVSPRAP